MVGITKPSTREVPANDLSALVPSKMGDAGRHRHLTMIHLIAHP